MVDRRRFVKYVGAGAIAGVAAGYGLRDLADRYASIPIPAIPAATTQTLTETTTEALSCSVTLRAAAEARGLLLGAETAPEYLHDARYANTLAREFNFLTPGNAMKWRPIHPGPDRWYFTPADEIANFASDHQMKVKGHAWTRTLAVGSHFDLGKQSSPSEGLVAKPGIAFNNPSRERKQEPVIC